ncbi:MAG: 3-isopropylmalate dehydratase small subunit [Synergistetes bacterium]|nr:MAG: 3-isopropylmalate dehydratase small subunit [bacterium 42_11]MBC7331476.1 3-isopropylmalate dehydratase small subunit [Synergistota bacterium]MDK2871140.1 3-isopropylmalate/(R)-2-methylmalate dehydratase small subunit [bacterium]
MIIKGRVWKYGDDINTDVIFPGKYTYTVLEPSEMAKHALEDLDPSFAKEARPGDIIVAGKNFGCGSSREQAATCLKALGIGAVVAKSFARIFYRNAINQGLLVIQCPELFEFVVNGEEIKIDVDKGEIHTLGGKVFRFSPLPEFVRRIIDDGGLIPHLRKRFKER